MTASASSVIETPRTPEKVQAKPVRRKSKKKSARAFWVKQLHTWHWISAALSLVAMLLFAVTGITLNHAGSIPGNPVVVSQEANLSPSLLRLVGGEQAADAPLDPKVAAEVAALTRIKVDGVAAEWTEDEAYVAVPGPGRDAWVSIDRHSGAIQSERTDRGWISFLNDLHKGRNTGTAWMWFIDIFAGACVIFTLTGLILLQIHSKHRPLTWPMVGLGAIGPVILILLFMHL